MNRVNVYVRIVAVSVAIGLAAALVLLPATAYALTVARQMPLLYAPIAGVWFLPPLTAMLLLKRPGAGVITSTVAGLMMLTTTQELRTVVGMAALGALLEAAVAIRRYRSWDKRIFAVALIVACALHAWSSWSRLDLTSVGMPTQLAFVALMVISAEGSLVLAALLARIGEVPWIRAIQGKRPDTDSGASRSIAAGWMYDGGSGRKPDTTP